MSDNIQDEQKLLWETVRNKVKGFDELGKGAQNALVQMENLNQLDRSPNTVRLIQEGRNAEAAEAFFNNNAYRKAYRMDQEGPWDLVGTYLKGSENLRGEEGTEPYFEPKPETGFSAEEDQAKFDEYVDEVIKLEGGYVDHPKDPGKETKYGISKGSFPEEDIKNLTKERAKEIYKKHYWDKLDIGDRTFGHLDKAVNMGMGFYKKHLQGVDEDDIVNKARDHYLHLASLGPVMRKGKLVDYKHFINGWMNRLYHTDVYSKRGINLQDLDPDERLGKIVETAPKPSNYRGSGGEEPYFEQAPVPEPSTGGGLPKEKLGTGSQFGLGGVGGTEDLAELPEEVELPEEDRSSNPFGRYQGGSQFGLSSFDGAEEIAQTERVRDWASEFDSRERIEREALGNDPELVDIARKKHFEERLRNATVSTDPTATAGFDSDEDEETSDDPFAKLVGSAPEELDDSEDDPFAKLVGSSPEESDTDPFAKLVGSSRKDEETDYPGKMDMFESAVSGVAKGGTFGVGENITAGAYAVEQTIKDWIDDEEDLSFGEHFDRGKMAARDFEQQAEQDNSKTFLAGEVFGGVAASIGVGRLRPFQKLYQSSTAGALATQGALEGGLAGTGYSEKEGAAVVEDTAKGAAIGGVGGAAFGKLFQIVGPRVGRALKRKLGIGEEGMELAEEESAKIARDTLGKGGDQLDKVARETGDNLVSRAAAKGEGRETQQLMVYRVANEFPEEDLDKLLRMEKSGDEIVADDFKDFLDISDQAHQAAVIQKKRELVDLLLTDSRMARDLGFKPRKDISFERLEEMTQEILEDKFPAYKPKPDFDEATVPSVQEVGESIEKVDATVASSGKGELEIPEGASEEVAEELKKVHQIGPKFGKPEDKVLPDPEHIAAARSEALHLMAKEAPSGEAYVQQLREWADEVVDPLGVNPYTVDRWKSGSPLESSDQVKILEKAYADFRADIIDYMQYTTNVGYRRSGRAIYKKKNRPGDMSMESVKELKDKFQEARRAGQVTPESYTEYLEVKYMRESLRDVRNELKKSISRDLKAKDFKKVAKTAKTAATERLKRDVSKMRLRYLEANMAFRQIDKVHGLDTEIIQNRLYEATQKKATWETKLLGSARRVDKLARSSGVDSEKVAKSMWRGTTEGLNDGELALRSKIQETTREILEESRKAGLDIRDLGKDYLPKRRKRGAAYAAAMEDFYNQNVKGIATEKLNILIRKASESTDDELADVVAAATPSMKEAIGFVVEMRRLVKGDLTPASIAEFIESGSIRDLKKLASGQADTGALHTRSGLLPEFVLDHNIGRILGQNITEAGNLAFIEPIARRLDGRIGLLKGKGALDSARTLEKYRVDVSGQSRPDVLKMTEGILNQLSKRVGPEQAAAIEQWMDLMGNAIYPNVVGSNPASWVRNLTQPLTKTLPEMGTFNPVTVAKAYGRALQKLSNPAERARLKADGIISDAPYEMMSEMDRAIQGRAGLALSTVNKFNKASMSIYNLTDSINRVVTAELSDEMTKVIAAGARSEISGLTSAAAQKQALKSIEHFPPALKHKTMMYLQNRGDVRLPDLRRDIRNHFEVQTQLAYGKVGNSEFVRDHGRLLSMMTKWPVAVASDMYLELERKQFARFATKYAGPAILASLGASLLKPEEGEEGGWLQVWMGTQYGANWTPGSAVMGFEMTPPIIAGVLETGGGILRGAKGAVTGDEQDMRAGAKGVKKGIQQFLPIVGWGWKVTDRMQSAFRESSDWERSDNLLLPEDAEYD